MQTTVSDVCRFAVCWVTVLVLAAGMSACGPTPAGGPVQQPTPAVTPAATYFRSAPTAPRTPTPLAGAAAPTPSDGTVRVTLGDNYFYPAKLTVAPNTKVEFSNEGGMQHMVVSYSNYFSHFYLGPGGKYSVAFGAPGTYRYLCPEHSGMEGVVEVRE